MNVLILSCGTRNKIVQYFKKELAGLGSVIAADCSKLAPALYEADRHHIVPRIESDDYLDAILEICRENNIRAVLSLIDPELSFLARHRELFLENGVFPTPISTWLKCVLTSMRWHVSLRHTGILPHGLISPKKIFSLTWRRE